MQKQLDLFKKHLPRKTYCCDTFENNKVRKLAHALEYQHIQPNDFNSQTWFVYDIDRATCPDEIRNDKLAPEPTLFVSNPENRHAHLYYLLNTPVHKNSHSSQKSQRYAAAVDAGLALKLDADLGYAGLLAKNADHERWQLLESYGKAYTLHELAESVENYILNDLSNDPMYYGLGRNCQMFESIRIWAYKAIRRGYPAYEQWCNAVLQRAEMLNTRLDVPLPYSECKSISLSIARWTHKNLSKEGFSEWQSQQGSKGGKAKGQRYEYMRMRAIRLRHSGMSFRAIADQIGCSKSVVANWVSKVEN
ncbi:MAG: plasmid replication protein [Endozoicomonadaceae bacterium]|nr:plasmid replication protein [Endozoicomonadaceae bacterium]